MRKRENYIRISKCPCCGSDLIYEIEMEVGCLKCGTEGKGNTAKAAWRDFWRNVKYITIAGTPEKSETTHG